MRAKAFWIPTALLVVLGCNGVGRTEEMARVVWPNSDDFVLVSTTYRAALDHGDSNAYLVNGKTGERARLCGFQGEFPPTLLKGVQFMWSGQNRLEVRYRDAFIYDFSNQEAVPGKDKDIVTITLIDLKWPDKARVR